MSLVQTMGTRVLLDLTKNTLGGGAVVSSCSQSCASCPSAGTCGAASGYGGFGSSNGMTFTSQGGSGAGTGINAGVAGAAVIHQDGSVAVDSAQQDGSCNAGQGVFSMHDINIRSVDHSRIKKSSLDLLISRGSLQYRPRESTNIEAAPSRSGDVVTDVLRELGLL